MFRHVNQPVFVQDHVLGRHAVDVTAERRARCLLAHRAGNPTLHENRGDPVAPRHAHDAGANFRDFAGAVRQRHEREPLLRVVVAAQNQEVPVIERASPNAHEDLVRSRLRVRSLDEREIVDAESFGFDNFHGTSTILPCAPGSMTIWCARGASANGNSSRTTGRTAPLCSPAMMASCASASSGPVALNNTMPRIAASRPIASRGLISTGPRLPITTMRPPRARTVKSLARFTLASISMITFALSPSR